MDKCNNEEALNELISTINTALTVGCQLPFTVPKKELRRIIEEAKKRFYKIYEDAVEETYLALPAKAFAKQTFSGGIKATEDTISTAQTDSSRGIVKMPDSVYSVLGIYEMGRFSGEAGGGTNLSWNGGDLDFTLDRFIVAGSYDSSSYADNLMFYVINSSLIDLSKMILKSSFTYNYNRLSNKLRFLGKLPKNTCIFHVLVKLDDCSLFQDEIFIRYCVAQAKVQLGRILGAFDYNLPGEVKVNYEAIANEGKEEITEILEEIKESEGTDWFLVG